MTPRTRFLIVAVIAAAIAFGFYLRRTARRSPTPSQTTTTAAPTSTATAAATTPRRRRATRRLRGSVQQRIDLSAAQRTARVGEIGHIEGRVLSYGDNLGVAGAKLSFDNGSLHPVEADERGNFSFSPPQEGVYELALATAEGYLPIAPEYGHSAMVFSARRDVGLSGVRVFLVKAAACAVTVLAADDPPRAVAGVTVRVLGEPVTSPSLALGPWKTNYKGHAFVQLRDFAIVEVFHPVHGSGRARFDFAAQVRERLVITLASADAAVADASLSGTVFADGQPLSDVLVMADYRAANPAKTRAALEPTRRALTDERGHFTMTGMTVGRYDLSASAPGFAPLTERGVAVPGPEVELRLDDSGSLFGKVTAAHDGSPIPSFVVVVRERLGPLRQEVVVAAPTFDPAGEYDIPALPIGTFLVTVSTHGFAPSAAREVTIGKEDVEVDFTLARGATLSGTVVDADTGQPLEAARVSLEGNFGGRRAVQLYASSRTDAQGRFSLRGVAAGVQSVLVAAADHHGKLMTIVVTAGATPALTIALAPTVDDEAPRIELAGIGAVLSAKDEVMMVGTVVAGGGAIKAGLAADDAIVAVDGIPVVELGFAGAIRKIRGPIGSVVVLTVRKAGSDGTIQLEVTRRKIRSP